MESTQQLTEQLDIAWLKTILLADSKKNTISKIVNYTVEDGAVKGENYSSKIYQIKIEVILETGRKLKTSVVLKKALQKADGEMLMEFPVFKTEIQAYTEILTKFEDLMNEYEDRNDLLWGKLIGYQPYKTIVFEDLKATNYKLPDRRKALDLDHALLVMHSLGRFHGISRVLLKKGLLTGREDLGGNIVASDTHMTRRMFEGGYKQLAYVMETCWPPEWKETADKFVKYSTQAGASIRDAFKFPKNGYLVLCHGDCWTCNLMFKYCPYEEHKPIAVKFLDFQGTNFNSYILDLSNFIYMSVRPSLRRENMDKFFNEYRKSLINTLEFYNCKDEPIPTLAEIHAEDRRVRNLSMFWALLAYPVSTMDSSDCFDMEKLMGDCDPKEVYNPETFKSENFRNVIEFDLPEWIKQGLIKI